MVEIAFGVASLVYRFFKTVFIFLVGLGGSLLVAIVFGCFALFIIFILKRIFQFFGLFPERKPWEDFLKSRDSDYKGK